MIVGFVTEQAGIPGREEKKGEISITFGTHYQMFWVFKSGVFADLITQACVQCCLSCSGSRRIRHDQTVGRETEKKGQFHHFLDLEEQRWGPIILVSV